jgi:hypothetical protein
MKTIDGRRKTVDLAAKPLVVLHRSRNDLIDWPEPANSFISTGEHTFFRADKIGSALSENLDVRNGSRMQPHLAVHRRRD